MTTFIGDNKSEYFLKVSALDFLVCIRYVLVEVRGVQIREREVERHLVKEMEKLGLRCDKFVPDQLAGMPDRIVLLPDRRVIWVETKKPKGGRVAELQKYRHEMLRKAGHEVVIVWTKEEADALAARLKRELAPGG